MVSAFEAYCRLGPAAFIVKAILTAIAANLLLLGFILLRRTYRKRYFAKRDARLLSFRRNWKALISGAIPFQSWRTKPFDLEIVETIVLDAFEAADRDEAARLLRFLRASGLIEKLIFDARQHRGWKRNRALVALGRTRAPEGIPALAEALRDRDLETRVAAVRALGRNACPQAGEELLNWIAESGLRVPALPLQSALIRCCSERPRMLLPYLQSSDKPTREVLGRVLGEIATPALGSDMLQFVEDEQAELRAATARALPHTEPGLAIDILAQLTQDPVWFVRLRAVVSMGRLCHSGAVPSLLRCVRDPNRLVRLRAAEALIDLKVNTALIFEQVVATHDRYALHAYLTALDNAGLQMNVRGHIQSDNRISPKTKGLLLQVLDAGTPETQDPLVGELALARAAAQS
jgi:HEAT repeat protein